MGYRSKVLTLGCIFIIIYVIIFYWNYKDSIDETKQSQIIFNSRNRPDAIYFNSCADEKMPSFQHMGRISEQKCAEYVWKRIQFEKCEKSKKKHVFGILGGYAARPGEFPHMAAVGYRTLFGNWSFQCGASIISPKFAVTAAHCSKSRKDPLLQNQVPEIVRLGVINLESSPSNRPKDVSISRIIKHPMYNSPKKYYDIALLEFQEEVKFGGTIQPACLWSKSSTKPLGKKVVTSGWGVTSVDKLTPSSVLRAVNLFIISSGLCEYLLKDYTNRNWRKLADHQLCAGERKGGHDSCQGDSGGPLQVEMKHQRKMYFLIGVTSFSHKCGLQDSPGLYTNVASFIDWIEDNVWKEEINQRQFYT